jgi:hypothetical protein
LKVIRNITEKIQNRTFSFWKWRITAGIGVCRACCSATQQPPGGVWRQSQAVVFYLNERNRNAFTEDQAKREILDRKRLRDHLRANERQGAD